MSKYDSNAVVIKYADFVSYFLLNKKKNCSVFNCCLTSWVFFLMKKLIICNLISFPEKTNRLLLLSYLSISICLLDISELSVRIKTPMKILTNEDLAEITDFEIMNLSFFNLDLPLYHVVLISCIYYLVFFFSWLLTTFTSVPLS